MQELMNGFLTGIAYEKWILDVLLILPLIGAGIVLFAPEKSAKRIALAITLVEFVLSIGIWWVFIPTYGGLQFYSTHAWIPNWGIAYRVGIDGISLFMVLLTTFTMPLTVLGSWNYIKKQQKSYYVMLIVLITGMLGVFVSMDLFLFYVFWELMLIPMYFIIGIWGGARRLYAAIKFFIYTFVGSLLMLVAILWIYYVVGRETGIYSFDYNHIVQNIDIGKSTAVWLFLAFGLAFAIKVPIFPFHTWLPDAHVEAPTAGSVILAGILLKTGAYGFLRFALPFFPDIVIDPTVETVVVTLAVVGIIYGALVAMVQPDFKKLIAYSSVSHLGFVILGIWALTVESVSGAIVIMINHGISTGALFFLAGMAYERRHTRLIADFGGIARVVPAFATVLTIVALSSIGLPGTNGFIGEFLVLLGSFGKYPVATVIATTGVIFAAVYVLWVLQRMIFNKLDNPENESIPDLNKRELAILVPLLAVIFWIGLYPKPILRRVEPTTRVLISRMQAAEASVIRAQINEAVEAP